MEPPKVALRVLFQCEDAGICAYIVHLCKTEKPEALAEELDPYTLLIVPELAPFLLERAKEFMRNRGTVSAEGGGGGGKKKKKKQG